MVESLTNHRKNLLRIVLLGISMLTLLCLFFSQKEKKSTSELPINIYKIYFNEVDQTIYVRARSWGLSGNHEEIIFSFSPINKETVYNKNADIAFYTSEVYYRQQGKDSLVLYAPLSSIMPPPASLDTKKIKIVIKELKGYDAVNEYDKNYKKYGLIKISTYSPGP